MEISVNYRQMELADYTQAFSLWGQSEGVKLRGADSREGIAKYLNRNPGLSFVAESEKLLVGTIMAGHDGKRGYIQHLAVHESVRQKGIASQLLTFCLGALAQEQIVKSHVHILIDNELAKMFWRARGWTARQDIAVFSYINGGDENA